VSQRAVEMILGRILTDAEFRGRFFSQPVDVCRGDGLDLTPAELSSLLQLDNQAIATVAARLDPRIVRAIPGVHDEPAGGPSVKAANRR
jgi:hypothetical protein